MSAGIDYNLLSHERTNNLSQQFQQRLSARGTGGGPDTLRHMVLTNLINGNYDGAIRDVEAFGESKKDSYPIFGTRAGRYIEHCVDLILAVKSKREFPGLSGLPVAKQREMFEKVLDHFDELKHYLKRIEAINAEIQIDDIRSTVYVVKTLSIAVAVVLALGFTLDIIESIYGSYDQVLGDSAKQFTDWLFDFDNF
ncbi:MAG: hypothetical protein CL677_02995 [Bdellovibrionaceae bacterium]|nr:hypothetical protein [Pseudobdellovibrionaceae bacterium]|tara:strand:+ start:591 stop:1178 length:588 start_codon:yes stop_codon:yes gene_type:complete